MYYYNASKGGLACASEGLRGELRGTGVHIVTVYPGPVATDMGVNGLAKYESTWASRLSPMGNAETLGKLVVRAVEKKKARVVYPRSLAAAVMFPSLARWVTAMFTPPLK
jgi:short-subunit dehydrogenase